MSVWDYVALTERREENDKKKQNKAKEKITEYYKSQVSIIRISKTHLYSFSKNHTNKAEWATVRVCTDSFWIHLFNSKKVSLISCSLMCLFLEVEQTYDVQQYFAQTLPEQPTLAFDFQHLATESPICNARLAVNMRSVLSVSLILAFLKLEFAI